MRHLPTEQRPHIYVDVECFEAPPSAMNNITASSVSFIDFEHVISVVVNTGAFFKMYKRGGIQGHCR